MKIDYSNGIVLLRLFFLFGSNIEKLSICNLVVLGLSFFFWVNFATNLSPKKIKNKIYNSWISEILNYYPIYMIVDSTILSLLIDSISLRIFIYELVIVVFRVNFCRNIHLFLSWFESVEFFFFRYAWEKIMMISNFQFYKIRSKLMDLMRRYQYNCAPKLPRCTTHLAQPTNFNKI